MAYFDVLAQENGLSKGTDVWSAVNARADHAIRFIRGGFSIELKKSALSDGAAKNPHTLIVRDLAVGLTPLSVDIAFGSLFATTDINTIVRLNQAARKAHNIMRDEAAAQAEPVQIADFINNAPVAVLMTRNADASRSDGLHAARV